MKKKFKTLLLESINEFILLVKLNRPEVHNALNTQMMLDLCDLWSDINQDRGRLRCIVLTGSGEKSFCAGADLKQRNQMTVDEWREQHVVLEEAVVALSQCPIPVIAAVNGYAYGGGLELLLACDFAFAAGDATFSQSETKLGIMPGAMATQNLPRACGIRRAKEIIFTAKIFSAKEAFDWGIVNEIFDPNYLLNDVLSIAEQIVKNAPLANIQVKKALNQSLGCDLQSGYQAELEAYYQLIPTKDREEGILAFNERRLPNFKDK